MLIVFNILEPMLTSTCEQEAELGWVVFVCQCYTPGVKFCNNTQGAVLQHGKASICSLLKVINAAMLNPSPLCGYNATGRTTIFPLTSTIFNNVQRHWEHLKDYVSKHQTVRNTSNFARALWHVS